jgi:hypothetical protein
MMKNYHFSLGDSSVGPVGFCATVQAQSEAEAVKLLRKALEPYESGIGVIDREGAIDYVHVYINVGAITEKDIDEVEDQCSDA